MFIFLFLALFCQGLLAVEAYAQDDVVVEAPRILDESIEASRSVSILDENEIRTKNAPTVADLLRDLPGVEVVRQGPVGQTTSVFVRGANSEDTLVLIDGVQANDAMSPSNGYDFSLMSPANIERIEVYRGPQCVRFGGGALGGVINIVTKEGKGALAFRYGAEGGSYDTARVEGGVSGQSGPIGYSFAANGLQTQGFPAAAAQDGNTANEGAKIASASSKLVWRQNPSAFVSGTVRFIRGDSGLVAHGGPGGDDPYATAQSTQLLTALNGERRFFSDQLKSTLGLYYSETVRADSLPAFASNTDTSSDTFMSENQKVDSNHELILDDHNLVRLNLQWTRESGTSKSFFDGAETDFSRQSQSDVGEGATYLYESPTWFGDAGARLDEQSKVGNMPSERASLGRNFATGTRLSLTYGTGFKVPSLYQLYSSFGNASLHSETSDTWELTAEQKLAARWTGSAAYFQNRYQNMITFDSVSDQYQNIASAKSSGVELQTTYAVTQELKLAANYTFMNAIDNTTGLALIRRPQSSANLDVRYKINWLETFVAARYEGARSDVDPSTFASTTDDAYVLFNVGGSYEFYRALKVTLRIENLFDKKYAEVAGYGTPGFSYYVGINGAI